MNQAHSADHYFVPPPSPYPVTVNLGLFFLLLGITLRISDLTSGVIPILGGIALVLYGAFRWLGNIIREEESGKYHAREDRSFRIGMAHFIISELALFGSFLGALLYLRAFALPDLASMDPSFTLWPDFKGVWPTGGPESQPFTPLSPWGVPAVNSLLILMSPVALMWASKGILTENRSRMIAGLGIAIALGVVFLVLQALEYRHAAEAGVTLASGVYGTNFYMLTGLHGVHLVAGIIMLAVLLLRAFSGHFKPGHRVGIKIATWFWNFAVVMPGLLVFVFFYLL